ncbi:MAG: CDP-glucose 4,6-dehydratase, partial [bacterium]
SLKNNEAIEIRSPHAIRPWQHVLEPLRGYLLLVSKQYQDPQRYIGAWNFGPDEGSIVNVGELVDTLISKWGSGSWIDSSDKNQPHEAKLLKLDISKVRYKLGWKPKLNFDETMDLLVDWYLQDKVDYDFDVKQIKKYLES